MGTIIIENVPESVTREYGTRIKYTKDLIFPIKKDTEEMTLLEYINSNEYKNDEGEVFFTWEDFLTDLQKYKN